MTTEENGPFWQSRKFWMQVIAALVFAALAMTKAVEFTSEQVLVFVLGLAGIGISAHAATDIVSLITASRKPEAPGLGGTGVDAKPGDTIGSEEVRNG